MLNFSMFFQETFIDLPNQIKIIWKPTWNLQTNM